LRRLRLEAWLATEVTMPTKPVMIPRPGATAQPARWQTALATAVRDPLELLRRLRLDARDFPEILRADQGFRTRVPESYLERIQPENPRDPLLLQVLPKGAELLAQPGFGTDPVGDRAAMAAPGLLHKYHGRALLVTTGACAIHCRYCFRREFPYAAFSTPGHWDPALEYLRAHTEIRELILSGGDPLTLPDSRLRKLVRSLEQIPHLQRLRIHTRLPVVLPERIDDEFMSWIGKGRLEHVVVLHANHPREFAGTAEQAVTRLRASGVTLLNQSVLLAGVNDDVDTLCNLQEAGFRIGVLPYYLHLLDRTRGTGHFEVPEQRAQEIHAALRARLPGYLVPRLVREHPGAPGKTPA